MTHAIVGGFFVRPHIAPRGELQIGGEAVESVPFTAPWDGLWSCLHLGPQAPAIAPRPTWPPSRAATCSSPGSCSCAAASRSSAPARTRASRRRPPVRLRHQRRPPPALRARAVDCRRLRRPRAPDDAGLTLAELADLLVALGARDALNLDRGGSAFVTRALARELSERGAHVTLVVGSRRDAGEMSDARAFYSGLDVHEVDVTPALVAKDPMTFAGPPGTGPLSRRSRTARTPDRVFASLDDAAYRIHVEAWTRALNAADASGR